MSIETSIVSVRQAFSFFIELLMKLLIDTDPGIDDLLALLLALHSRDVDVVAITTVAGNVGVAQTTKNVYTLFDILSLHQQHIHRTSLSIKAKTDQEVDLQDHDFPVPWQIYSHPMVAVGAAGPLAGKGNTPSASIVHGDDGMGNISNSAISQLTYLFSKTVGSVLFHTNKAHESGTSSSRVAAGVVDNSSSKGGMYSKSKRDAADEILWQLDNNEDKSLALVFIGPLTNLAIAIQRDSARSGSSGVDQTRDLPTLRKAKHIYIMGGCISNQHPGGNITPHAEFNFYADPDAARLVLGSGLPITLVPLDVTERCRLTFGAFETVLVPLAGKAPLPSFCVSFMRYIFDSISRIHTAPSPFTQFWNPNDGIGNPNGNETGTTATASTAITATEKVAAPHAPKKASTLAMHDPLCMAIALDPTLVTKSIQLSLDVECEPNARTKGMCLADFRRWKLVRPQAAGSHSPSSSSGSSSGTSSTSAANAGTESAIETESSVHHTPAASNSIENDAFTSRRKDHVSMVRPSSAPPARSLADAARPHPDITVVLDVDTNRFFSQFMDTVFGVCWDDQEHAWTAHS